MALAQNRARVTRRRLLQGAVGLAGLGLAAGCGLGSLPGTPWAKKVPRIGYITTSPSPPTPNAEALRQELDKLGYVEGETVIFEFRSAEGREERVPDLVRELLALPVDVIVASSTDTARMAAQATTTVPIVAPTMANPLGSGVIASLDRPGGNVTGGTSDVVGNVLPVKRLSLLKEVVPGLTKVAVLWSSTYSPIKLTVDELQRRAPGLGVELLTLDAVDPNQLPGLLAQAREWGAQALTNTGSPSVLDTSMSPLVRMTTEAGLPAIYSRREWVDAGGLMSYGANFVDQWRRGAIYVDKILKGAKPADLPVQQPSAFDFPINMKTAGTLGLTVPQAVLQQATELIQ